MSVSCCLPTPTPSTSPAGSHGVGGDVSVGNRAVRLTGSTLFPGPAAVHWGVSKRDHPREWGATIRHIGQAIRLLPEPSGNAMNTLGCRGEIGLASYPHRTTLLGRLGRRKQLVDRRHSVLGGLSLVLKLATGGLDHLAVLALAIEQGLGGLRDATCRPIV